MIPPTDDVKPEHSFTDSQIGEVIEEVLRSDDLDKDGYIDYAEFMISQKKDRDEQEELDSSVNDRVKAKDMKPLSAFEHGGGGDVSRQEVGKPPLPPGPAVPPSAPSSSFAGRQEESPHPPAFHGDSYVREPALEDKNNNIPRDNVNGRHTAGSNSDSEDTVVLRSDRSRQQQQPSESFGSRPKPVSSDQALHNADEQLRRTIEEHKNLQEQMSQRIQQSRHDHYQQQQQHHQLQHQQQQQQEPQQQQPHPMH